MATDIEADTAIAAPMLADTAVVMLAEQPADTLAGHADTLAVSHVADMPVVSHVADTLAVAHAAALAAAALTSAAAAEATAVAAAAADAGKATY